MTITFFKQDELIESKKLMSVSQGEERLKLATIALFNYFDTLANDRNQHVKEIIRGWHRGYTIEAVADYLFNASVYKVVDAEYPVKEVGELINNMIDLMGYRDLRYTSWGKQYDYQPSLEEVEQDPLDVQLAINTRARAAAKKGGFEAALFGTYQNNTGTVSSEDEVNEVRKFRIGVGAILASRQRKFFTATEVDTANV